MIRVCVAACAEDAQIAADLRKHLVMLRRTGVIEFTEGIGAARLVVVVLTTAFVADEASDDMLTNIQSASKNGARVVALLPATMDLWRKEDRSREPAWFETIARMPYATKRDQNGCAQGMDAAGIPIATWRRTDDAWAEVCREIRDEVAALEGGR